MAIVTFLLLHGVPISAALAIGAAAWYGLYRFFGVQGIAHNGRRVVAFIHDRRQPLAFALGGFSTAMLTTLFGLFNVVVEVMYLSGRSAQ